MWRLRAGQCVRRFPKAHAQGVTCVRFSRDGSQVVSGSFDQVVRVHGLKSGKAIKEMRGHASYVNDVHFSPDGSRVVSASSDGTVRVWDAGPDPNPDLDPNPNQALTGFLLLCGFATVGFAAILTILAQRFEPSEQARQRQPVTMHPAYSPHVSRP